MLSERRVSFHPQPKETVPYEVKQNDTIEGIAARYNITPSELVNINKLISRTIFSGQIIYLPEKNSPNVPEDFRKTNSTNASSSDHESPKPGHVERVPGSETSSEDIFSNATERKSSADLLSSVLQDDFSGKKESLRINSKYVTDGEGVVSGVLIITRNQIYFDPNVSDPLVIEYGMAKYGVEAPMSWIVKVAFYSDIFRMRRDSLGKTVNVYHSKAVCLTKSKSEDDGLAKTEKTIQMRRCSSSDFPSKRRESGLSKSSSFQENLSKITEQADDAEEDKEQPEDNTTKGLTAKPSDLNDNTQSTNENKNTIVNKPLSDTSSIDSDEDGGFSEYLQKAQRLSMSDDEGNNITFELEQTKKKSGFEKTKNKLHKHLKRMSITDSLLPNFAPGRRMSLPLFSSLTENKEKNTTAKNQTLSASNCDKSSEADHGGFMYVNMVEEKPELFAPLDKLIPRPAASFCNTPLYLCLRMGEPINHSTRTASPILHFSQKMKQEYWFSIPKDNVDCLYNFFLRWCPEKYGEIDNIDYQELGYIPIGCDESEAEENKSCTEQRRASWAFPWRRKSKDSSEVNAATCTSSPEDWEFLDYLSHIGSTVHVPELLTPSTILSDEQILEIGKKLPARAMNAWSLIYSTTAHGFSLKTMYRKMQHYSSPVLIVIENRRNAIFGALLSAPLKMSDKFYGTGESFLFTFSPEFKVFHWAGSNNYFIKGNIDSFLVGSSEGHFGLWLDDDLYRGRTNSCETFANDPLCAEEDFVVKSIEAWGFP